MGTALKRVIDDTQLPPDEAAKLAKKRAYNRESANRARKRNKILVTTLQEELDKLSMEKKDLLRKNEAMRARLAFLEMNNETLLLAKLAYEKRQSVYWATATAGMPISAINTRMLPLSQQNIRFSNLGPSRFKPV